MNEEEILDLKKKLYLIGKVFQESNEYICKQLNKSVPNGIGINSVKCPTIKKSSKFEVGLYLLFRLYKLVCSYQNEDPGRILITTCMDSILPSQEDKFIEIAIGRVKVYKQIFFKVEKAEGEPSEWKMECNEWLINAILYSKMYKNNYNKMMDAEKVGYLITDAFMRQSMKIKLADMEIYNLLIFEYKFRYLFNNNSDFRELSLKEMITRMFEGEKEATLILDKPSQK
jgi:hypothetical protein